MYWRIFIYLVHYKEDQWSFPGGTSGEEPTCQCKRHKTCRLDPWVRKIPWRRAWQPTPVFLPGESHGQRSPVDHSAWGCKELEMTEVTYHACTFVLKRNVFIYWIKWKQHQLNIFINQMKTERKSIRWSSLYYHWVLVTQLCPTLWGPMDCSLLGSSVHSISQARMLEWVVMPSSRASSRPRDRTSISCISCIGRRVLYHRGHLGRQSK